MNTDSNSSAAAMAVRSKSTHSATRKTEQTRSHGFPDSRDRTYSQAPELAGPQEGDRRRSGSGRGPTKGTRYPLVNYISYHQYKPAYQSFIAQISNLTKPKSYSEAIVLHEWQVAMRFELQALQENGTWSLTSLPAGKTPIGCRWVYKIKHKSYGSIEWYKAQLVAKGFTQLEGVDYQDTFSATAKIIYVRCLLALAAACGWSLHQLDVNNAFLHGNLQEEIYMSLPLGLWRQGEEHLVCCLHKSLYRLKHASCQWFAKFSEAIRSAGFVQSKADYSLFTRKQGKSSTSLLIYVDDILITGNDLRKYALEIIKDAGLLGAAPIDTPMERGWLKVV
ncbi:hypothetical protein KPL70_002448 [Citrus sinensis]|nr:hypothetical protein KPL70_002448 [Citrus sinensis]KAH9789501.1 hypothetical protein KPL71_003038 [Citrus sinensis]